MITDLCDADEERRRLKSLVEAAPVMLFMKGTPTTSKCQFRRVFHIPFPDTTETLFLVDDLQCCVRFACSFSTQVLDALNECKVQFGYFNIMSSEDVRQASNRFYFFSFLCYHVLHEMESFDACWCYHVLFCSRV
jgi:glutaredoxin-related protein